MKMQKRGVYLFVIYVAGSLLTACVADAQLVDGDLTCWRYYDTRELEETYGLFEFSSGDIVAFGLSSLWILKDDEWVVGTTPGPQDYIKAITQGPDDKLWMMEWAYIGYWEDGKYDRVTHRTDALVLDVLRWRGRSFICVGGGGMGPCLQVYEYAEPFLDSANWVAGTAGWSPEWRQLLTGCGVSGDFLIMNTSRLRIMDITTGENWDLPDKYTSRCGSFVGANSYVWSEEDSGGGLLQIDAIERTVAYVSWFGGKDIHALAMDSRGLWILGRGSFGDDGEAFFVSFWALQGPEPEKVRFLPECVGSSGEFDVFVTIAAGYFTQREMLVTSSGALWFATEKAVCRWSPDSDLIPMPYQARVEARATEDRTVQVEIEFDNLRIIRNDAMLHLKIECLGVDEEDPVWLSASYQVYHEFQPQETFRYSFEYFPFVLPSMDRIRYSVYTTDIDVNAPPATPDDEPIITSNVATAEVRLD